MFCSSKLQLPTVKLNLQVRYIYMYMTAGVIQFLFYLQYCKVGQFIVMFDSSIKNVLDTAES